MSLRRRFLELDELKSLGATPVKNSGRGRFHKADGILAETVTVDIKEYEKSFGITKKIWAKLRSDARDNKTPDAIIKLVLGKEGEPKLRLVIAEEDYFKELHGRQEVV